MAIGYATVKVNITAFVVDGIDSDDLPDDRPLTAKLVLTPMIAAGKTLQFNDDGVTKLKAVSALTVDIGASGDISHQGRDFVKVVAPTIESTNMARLQWRAEFKDIRLGGDLVSLQIDPIHFWVDPDVVVNIADHVNVAPSIALPLSRGPRGFGLVGVGSSEDGIVFTYESEDGPVDSDPVPVAVEASDSTVAALVVADGSETKAQLDASFAPVSIVSEVGGIAAEVGGLADEVAGKATLGQITAAVSPKLDKDEAEATFVRSVNGVPVDPETGDVEVESGGLDPAALAAELNNPETAANSAVVGIVSGVVPSGLMPFVDATADLATPRPSGHSGPVVWIVPVGTEEPVHKATGDLYARATETVIEWTPAGLPNLHSWYDAQAITGVAAGVEVAQWNDLSGSAHHAKQATSGSQPIYRATGLNGHPCLEFDGTNDILVTDAFTTSTAEPWTVYAVAQSTPATTVGSDHFFDAVASNGTTPTRLAAYRTATNTLVISRGTAITSPPSLDNTVNRMKFVFNGGSSSVKVGGDTPVTGTTSLSGVEVAKLALGGRGDANAANLLVGFLGELIFVKGTVTSEDDAKVTSYLQSKWGVA